MHMHVANAMQIGLYYKQKFCNIKLSRFTAFYLAKYRENFCGFAFDTNQKYSYSVYSCIGMLQLWF